MKILIDTSVIRDSDFSEPSQTVQEVNWEGQIYKYDLPGYKKKKPRSDKGGWRQKQIDCLPTIGRLIREKNIHAYMTPEIGFEQMKGRSGSQFQHVLKGFSFHKIGPAIDRSFFQQMDFGDFIDKDKIIEFCDLLLSLNQAMVEKLLASPLGEKLPNNQQNNLRNLEVFREICHGIATTHYPDAFHFWTAAANNLDYFLLIDKKFQNVMRNQKLGNINTQTIAPAELLNLMNVSKLDPPPLEEETFYSLIGQKIPLRL